MPSAAASALADMRSALLDRVRGLALEAHFSRAALRSGEELAGAAAQWIAPLAWFRPDAGPVDALQCEVADADGERRLTTVYLYRGLGEMAVATTCSCGRPSCFHAAAILIRLRRLIDWPRFMTPAQRWRCSLDAVARPRPPARRRQDPYQVRCLLAPRAGQLRGALQARLIVADRGADLRHLDQWQALERMPAEAVPARAVAWLSRLLDSPRTGVQGTHELRGPDGEALLTELIAAGICHHLDTLRQIRAGAARPARWKWQFDAQARACLVPDLCGDGSVTALALDRLWYFDEATAEIGPLDMPPALWEHLSRLPPLAPGDDDLRLDWPPHPMLAAIPPPPGSPRLREIRESLRPVIVVGASRRTRADDYVLYVTVRADYGGHRLPLGHEPWNPALNCRDGTGYVTVYRQVEQELAARNALSGIGLVPLGALVPGAGRDFSPPPDLDAMALEPFCQGPASLLVPLEGELQRLRRAGFVLEHAPDLPLVILPDDTPMTATLQPGKAPGWTQFQLTIDCEDGQIDVLPEVIRGLQRRDFSLVPAADEPAGARWLAPLGPGRFLPLPLSRLRDWLLPIATYLGRPRREHELVEVPFVRAIALDDRLRDNHVRVAGSHARDIADILARLRAAQQSPGRMPAGFRGRLRPYQAAGLNWLQALRRSGTGGILADDMGLGKTVQVIAHLLLEKEAGRLERPALVVAPTSLVFNWVDELARFAPSLSRLHYAGNDRALLAGRLPRAEVIIVSYALLLNDLALLGALDYAALVLDEAPWVKNPQSQTTRAVRAIRARNKLVLTGTPLENHTGELWNHMDLVMPGYLGDRRAFQQAFRTPIEKRGDDRRLAALQRLISPFILRRTKAQVAPELPPKSETVLRIAMGPEQRQLYESLRLSLSREVRAAMLQYEEAQSRIVVLSALLRLRQVCCDPRLLDPGGARTAPSAKLDALLDLVRTLRRQGQQLLVFSQFASMLELISTALRVAQFDHDLLTGSTRDRQAPVRRFQAGEVPILLASLKAGGLGLNLTAADAVIQYDPWWNPAAENQAEDRAHRIGRDHPVFVYKLLCEDTIEDKVASMKDHKSALARDVLGDGTMATGMPGDFDIATLFYLQQS